MTDNRRLCKVNFSDRLQMEYRPVLRGTLNNISIQTTKSVLTRNSSLVQVFSYSLLQIVVHCPLVKSCCQELANVFRDPGICDE